jgi:hypothetical protein
VLEEKTKNNLGKDESEHLTHLLHELRSRFVQVMQLVAAQGGVDAAAGDLEETDADADDVAPTASPAATKPPKGRIITE